VPIPQVTVHVLNPLYHCLRAVYHRRSTARRPVEKGKKGEYLELSEETGCYGAHKTWERSVEVSCSPFPNYWREAKRKKPAQDTAKNESTKGLPADKMMIGFSLLLVVHGSES